MSSHISQSLRKKMPTQVSEAVYGCPLPSPLGMSASHHGLWGRSLHEYSSHSCPAATDPKVAKSQSFPWSMASKDELSQSNSFSQECKLENLGRLNQLPWEQKLDYNIVPALQLQFSSEESQKNLGSLLRKQSPGPHRQRCWFSQVWESDWEPFIFNRCLRHYRWRWPTGHLVRNAAIAWTQDTSHLGEGKSYMLEKH